MSLWRVVTRGTGLIMADLVEEIACCDLKSRRFLWLVQGTEEAIEQLKQRDGVVSAEPATDGIYRDPWDEIDGYVCVVFAHGTRWKRVYSVCIEAEGVLPN